MDKVIDYKVIIDDSANYLATLVKIELQNGWELFGGASISHSAASMHFAQTLVKYEKGLQKA